MSWVGAEMWDVYVGERCSTCASVGSVEMTSGHTDVTTGVAAAFACVKQARRSWRRPQVRVWLSGALARPFTVAPIAGLRNWREAHELAAHLAPQSTGLREPCAVWVERLPTRESSVAVAVERSLLQTIVTAARTHRTPLTCVRPWWALALEGMADAGPGPALFAAEDDDAMTLLSAHSNVWSAADCYAPKPIPEQLEPLLARRSFAMAVPAEAVHRVRFGDPLAANGSAWPGGARVDSFATS